MIFYLQGAIHSCTDISKHTFYNNTWLVFKLAASHDVQRGMRSGNTGVVGDFNAAPAAQPPHRMNPRTEVIHGRLCSLISPFRPIALGLQSPHRTHGAAESGR